MIFITCLHHPISTVSATPILEKSERVSVRQHNFSDRRTTVSPTRKVVRGNFSGVGRILHNPQLITHVTTSDPDSSERPDVHSGLQSIPFSVWQPRFPYLFTDDNCGYGISAPHRALAVHANELVWKSPVPFSNFGTPPWLTDCSPQAAQAEIRSLLSRGVIQELKPFDRGFFRRLFP